MDFEQVKESVIAVARRVTDPFATQDISVNSTDNSVEVVIKSPESSIPVVVIEVSGEEFKVIKNVSINEELGTETYNSMFELTTFLLKYLYAAFAYLNKTFTFINLVSAIFGEKINDWQRLTSVVYERAGEQVYFGDDYYRYGDSIVQIDSNTRTLTVSGPINGEFHYTGIEDLVYALLSVYDTLFQYKGLEINPLLDLEVINNVDEDEVDPDEEGAAEEVPQGDTMDLDFGDDTGAVTPDEIDLDDTSGSEDLGEELDIDLDIPEAE